MSETDKHFGIIKIRNISDVWKELLRIWINPQTKRHLYKTRQTRFEHKKKSPFLQSFLFGVLYLFQ